jgi:uncharacterized protein involved in exopolysaccharide biosynthesis
MAATSTERAADYMDGAPAAYPRLGVVEAIRRHLLLFILPIVVCLGAALSYALSRAPTYTAEARMGIAKIDVTAPGALAGFALASQALAETYSRVISAEPLIADLATKFNVPRETIRTRLSAAPVPDTPVFRVVGTGPNARGAVLLANAATQSLQDYLNSLNTRSESLAVFARYKRAALRLSRATSARGKARADYRRSRSDRAQRALVKADAAVRVAQTEALALEELYRTTQQVAQNSGSLAQVLAEATTAKSDRGAKIQLFGGLGLLAGIALGAGLALLRAQLMMRRLALR